MHLYHINKVIILVRFSFFSTWLGEHVVEAKFSEPSDPEEEELVAHLEEESELAKVKFNALLESAKLETNGKSDDEFSTASEGENIRAYEEEGGEGHMVSSNSQVLLLM